MKYAVIVGDGMADEPQALLKGKTPLAYGKTPVMDALSARGEIGMVRTVLEGMTPGSKNANLSILGYDPGEYKTGRAFFEALAMGIPLQAGETAVRCNLVTLSETEGAYGERRLLDHSAGGISTGEAEPLFSAVKDIFSKENHRFYPGNGYRNLMVRKGGVQGELTPPHDVNGCVIGPCLPKDGDLRRMMEKSFEVLNGHPKNLERAAKGLKKANSLWFWGAGGQTELPSFWERRGMSGAMVSAADLIKGIGAAAGLDVIHVPGATGNLDTNYEGKAKAALHALLADGKDFVYVHLEAPDEMGHQGRCMEKVQAIENLDSRILGPVVEGLTAYGGAFKLLLLPDHPTPVRLKTHTADPVPYLLFDSRRDLKNPLNYNEADGKKSGILVESGEALMDRFLEKES